MQRKPRDRTPRRTNHVPHKTLKGDRSVQGPSSLATEGRLVEDRDLSKSSDWRGKRDDSNFTSSCSRYWMDDSCVVTWTTIASTTDRKRPCRAPTTKRHHRIIMTTETLVSLLLGMIPEPSRSVLDHTSLR